MRTALLVVLALTVLLLPAGCRGTDKEKTVTGARLFDEQEVKSIPADVPVVSQEIISDAALPEGYPKEIVPIITGSTITLSTKNEDEEKNVIYWVAFTTSKSVDEVRTYYHDVFKNAENVQQIDISGECSISGLSRDQSFTISISSVEIDGQKHSIVSIMVGFKEFLELK